MVTLTAEQIARAEAALAAVPRGAVRAMARAINRAVEAARAETVRQVQAAYHVTSAAIRETLTIARATPERLAAHVTSKGKRMPLHDFGPRPDTPGTGGPGKAPLAVATSKGEGRQPIAGAFVARMGSHLGVYVREGKKRHPLRELYGPAVPQMAGRADLALAIEARAQEMLDSRLDHEIGALLDGRAA